MLEYATDTDATVALAPEVEAAAEAIEAGWDERERRKRSTCCLPLGEWVVPDPWSVPAAPATHLER